MERRSFIELITRFWVCEIILDLIYAKWFIDFEIEGFLNFLFFLLLFLFGVTCMVEFCMSSEHAGYKSILVY